MLNDWHLRFQERKTPVSEVRDRNLLPGDLFPLNWAAALVSIGSRKLWLHGGRKKLSGLGTTLLVPPTLATGLMISSG